MTGPGAAGSARAREAEPARAREAEPAPAREAEPAPPRAAEPAPALEGGSAPAGGVAARPPEEEPGRAGEDAELGRAREAVRLSGSDPGRARVLATAVLRSQRRGLAAAEAERALGMAARRDQDMATAVQHLTRAIRLAERAGARQVAAEVRVSRALALAYQGRMRAALADLDRAGGVLTGPVLARVELQRAAVWQMQGKLDAALAAYDSAQPMLDRAGDTVALAVLHNNRGLVRSRRGLLAGAQADLTRAAQLHRELGNETDAAEAATNIGLVAARRGDVVAALAAFDEGDRLAPGSRGTDAVGLLDRTEALLTARLLREARATGERALAELTSRDVHAYLAEIRLILAQIALLDGRPAEARTLADQAAREFGRQRRPVYRDWATATAVRAAWEADGPSQELLTAAGRLVPRLEAAGWTMAALDARLLAGQVALALGRRDQVRRQLAPLAERRTADPAEVRSRVFHARALLRLADGDPRRADAALRAGMAAIERHRAALGGTELRVGASALAADLARLGVELAVSAGDPWRVLRWGERWRAGTLALRPVRPPAEVEIATALTELRQVVQAQQQVEGAASERLLRRQAAVERTVQRLARQGRVSDPYQADRPSAARLRAALGDRVLVEYVESGRELYAVVVPGNKAAGRQSLHRLGPSDPVAQSAMMLRFWLRRLLLRFGSPDRAERELLAEAARLDRIVLAPLAAELGSELVIAPTTGVHSVPWSLLPAVAGRPVSVVPSAAWWVRAAEGARQRAAAPGPGRVTLVAGPAVYPGPAVLTGAAATVDAVTAALDGAGLAHIAAHGSFRADQPLLSSLRLADGPLTAYDLERLTSAPRLIMLASCSVAMAEVRPGDELMGFAAALLAQGTGAVVAPLLPVPDEATRLAAHAVHRALRSGAGPAAALAAAGAGTDRYTAAAFLCLGAG
jgi:tetratricopeptide (TPR) repeat protein